MRVLLQRVNKASVSVDNELISSIEQGVLLLVGISETDTEAEVEWMVKKISDLRIFEDEDGKFNISLREIKGQILVVSQFTLYGDCRKGRRPSFSHAAPPVIAEPLCDEMIDLFVNQGFVVKSGKFGAHMKVNLVNDGPVTLMLEWPLKS